VDGIYLTLRELAQFSAIITRKAHVFGIPADGPSSA